MISPIVLRPRHHCTTVVLLFVHRRRIVGRCVSWARRFARPTPARTVRRPSRPAIPTAGATTSVSTCRRCVAAEMACCCPGTLRKHISTQTEGNMVFINHCNVIISTSVCHGTRNTCSVSWEVLGQICRTPVGGALYWGGVIFAGSFQHVAILKGCFVIFTLEISLNPLHPVGVLRTTPTARHGSLVPQNAGRCTKLVQEMVRVAHARQVLPGRTLYKTFGC